MTWQCWHCGDLTETPGPDPHRCMNCGAGEYEAVNEPLYPPTWVDAALNFTLTVGVIGCAVAIGLVVWAHIARVH